MCWSVQKPGFRNVPDISKLDMNLDTGTEIPISATSRNVPRGVFSDDPTKEAGAITAIAGAIFGFVLVGPIGALAGPGLAAGLVWVQTNFNNEIKDFQKNLQKIFPGGESN